MRNNWFLRTGSHSKGTQKTGDKDDELLDVLLLSFKEFEDDGISLPHGLCVRREKVLLDNVLPSATAKPTTEKWLDLRSRINKINFDTKSWNAYKPQIIFLHCFYKEHKRRFLWIGWFKNLVWQVYCYIYCWWKHVDHCRPLVQQHVCLRRRKASMWLVHQTESKYHDWLVV